MLSYTYKPLKVSILFNKTKTLNFFFIKIVLMICRSVSKMSKNRFVDSDDEDEWDKNSSAFWKEPEDLMNEKVELDSEHDDLPSYEELQPESIIISSDDSNTSKDEFILPNNQNQLATNQNFNSSNFTKEHSKDSLKLSSVQGSYLNL